MFLNSGQFINCCTNGCRLCGIPLIFCVKYNERSIWIVPGFRYHRMASHSRWLLFPYQPYHPPSYLRFWTPPVRLQVTSQYLSPQPRPPPMQPMPPARRWSPRHRRSTPRRRPSDAKHRRLYGDRDAERSDAQVNKKSDNWQRWRNCIQRKDVKGINMK